MIDIITAIDRCMNVPFEVFGFTINFKMVFIGSIILALIGKLISGIFEGGDSNAG